MRPFTLLIAGILLIGTVQAATLTGTVYDYSLEPVEGAIVTVNTTPEQTLVARNGTYNLHLPAGTYNISVSKATGTGLRHHYASTITVAEKGTYTHDLILFPELEEIEQPDQELLANETATTPEKQDLEIEHVILLIIGLALIATGAYRFRRRKPRKAETTEDPFAEKLLQHIKKEKTITQKDLRRHYAESESAISTAIARLEADGRIRKVKRGRANLLIYQK